MLNNESYSACGLWIFYAKREPHENFKNEIKKKKVKYQTLM